jgi:outer membrane immunogenic protein
MRLRVKSLVAGVIGLAALGIVGQAMAADLPAQTSTVPRGYIPAVFDWSGLYVGANGGWGSQNRCFDVATATGIFVIAEGCHHANGAVAGGQFGYRWQSGPFVFGVEALGDWADLTGSNASLAFPGFSNRSHVDAFGLLTGDIGFAWNNVLFYVKGGAAVMDNRSDILLNGAVVAQSKADTRWGTTAGAGVEYGFTPNWSASVEYDHVFVNNRLTIFNTSTPAYFGTEILRGDADLVTVRLIYRWGDPVMVKY